MHYLTLTAKLLLPLAITSACQQRQPVITHPAVRQVPTGVFVGLEEMSGMPPERPGDRWYHENIVYIRPDSLFLEGNPLVINQNKEKSYSASDGGFYSFSGRLDTTGGKLVARLRMFAHDYIAEPVIIEAKDTAATKNMDLEEAIRRGLAHRDSSFYKRTFRLLPTPTGFDMDGVHYIPTTPDSTLGLPGFPRPDRFFGKKVAARHSVR